MSIATYITQSIAIVDGGCSVIPDKAACVPKIGIAAVYRTVTATVPDRCIIIISGKSANTAG